MRCLWLGAALALAQPACTSHHVDTEDFETRIGRRVAELGLPPAHVTCPSDVDLKVGATFSCDVVIADKTYVLDATIQGASATGSTADIEMSTRWHQGDAVVAAKLAPSLAAGMTKAIGAPAAVSCGDALRFLTPERTVRCELTAGTTKVAIITGFDAKLDPTTWKLDPPTLQANKLEQILTPAVREQTTPDAAVSCGDQPLILRPSSGIVPCWLLLGGKRAELAVTVDDKLAVQRWEVAKPAAPAAP